MTHRNATPTDDSYPTPGAEFRAALVPLRSALVLSAALVLIIDVGGLGA